MEDDHVVRNETSESASAHPWDQWLQAFGNLLETLDRARTAPDSERRRYVSELTAVATFISTFDKQLGHRFSEFASRLGDLDKGRDDDSLFHPAKIWDRHPETPPYGGKWPDIVPHLSVACLADDQQLDIVANDFVQASRGKLPIRAIASEVALMDNRSGNWQVRAMLRLGSA